MARVVIRIDRVVLSGIVPSDRDAVVASLRAELRRAFSQRDVAARWAASGHRESMREGVPCTAKGAELGREAARRIAKGALA